MKKILGIMGVLLACSGIFAADVAEIMKRYDENRVYETARMKASLEIKDNLGTSYNEFETYRKKNGDTLITVTGGSDRGQKILRLGNSVYLYYPDAEEIIRLQGSALKDSVMGSDFTYEDLTGDNSILSNYNGELLGETVIDGSGCWHVMLTAKTRKQLYQKMELHIDKETFVERKSIVYSASGKALSESASSSFVQSGKYIVALKSTMKNLLKKSSITTMTVSEVELDMPIPEEYFSRDELSW